MKIIQQPFHGLFVIEPQIFHDERGFFFESYHQKKLAEIGICDNFVQDNQSFSSYGTIRGVHFQKEGYAQAKLVRVITGRVYDVAVDLRKNSPTFGQWFGIELSAQNHYLFYLPQGFGHGFSVLSETAILAYKCSHFYHQIAEEGLNYNDPFLNIDWKIPKDKQILSEKDKKLPFWV